MVMFLRTVTRQLSGSGFIHPTNSLCANLLTLFQALTAPHNQVRDVPRGDKDTLMSDACPAGMWELIYLLLSLLMEASVFAAGWDSWRLLPEWQWEAEVLHWWDAENSPSCFSNAYLTRSMTFTANSGCRYWCLSWWWFRSELLHIQIQSTLPNRRKSEQR